MTVGYDQALAIEHRNYWDLAAPCWLTWFSNPALRTDIKTHKGTCTMYFLVERGWPPRESTISDWIIRSGCMQCMQSAGHSGTRILWTPGLRANMQEQTK